MASTTRRDIPYDSVGPSGHWRIRHDSGREHRSILRLVATAAVWLTRKTVTPGFALTSLKIYLVAGAYGTGNSRSGRGEIRQSKAALEFGWAKFNNRSELPASRLPSLGFGNFQYGPTGGSWNFINGCRHHCRSGSGFTGGPFIPQGSQVAFIQVKR